MQCPKCGSPVNPGQKFCTKCGQPLNAAPQQPVQKSSNACPSCGAPLNPGQKFCTKCGTKIDVAPQSNQKAAPGEKGFIDNVRHFGTFIRQGSEGVDRLVRREQEARVRQQAADLGLEVNKPPRGGQQASPAQNAPAQGGQSASVQDGQPQPQNNQSQPQQPQVRRLTVDNTSVEGVNLVSGRAIWDIKKGEVARLVTESEFANAEGLKGVIVQEGCTAMVFIDGQFVSMMQAGVYTFPAKTQAEIQLQQRQREMDAEQKELEKERKRVEDEQRQKDKEYAQTFAARGVFGEVAAFGRGVMNFLFGKKKDESPEKHKQRVEKTQQKLKMLPSPKICRVYIVSNRVINLIFGSQETPEGMVDFAPMVIPTKLVDINVGVSMQLEIDNMQEFVKNYLADRKSVSILDFQQMLMPGVKATLTQMLRNLDYEQSGLPEPIVNNLKGKLQMTCGERLFGIRVVKVLDITDSSADFERFRAVERELYASEKELGFLQRTGEFRNRLEQEQNKQTIDRAQNAEELRRALQAINTDKFKDELLNKDELEQFVLLLESQQRIRKANLQKDEAVAMEEVRAALLDLKKCKLIKDDEFAALEVTLLRGRLERDDDTAALEAELLRRRMNREDDTTALEHELELRRMGRGDEVEILQSEIDQRRIDRDNITQIMRIQASQKEALAQQAAEFELSDNKMEHEMAGELRKAQHQGNLAAVQLDTKRLMDAYNDERNEFDWNRAFSRRQQEDDYDFNKTARQDDYDFNKDQRQQQANFQNRVQNEDYDWQKAQREAQMRREDEDRARFNARQDKYDDMDILERKAAIARQNMQEMQDRQFREQQEMNRFAESQQREANRSAESIHSMDVQERMHHASMEQQMTAEQLRETHRENLSEAAQVASFNAEGAKEQADFFRKQQEEEARRREEDRMRAQEDADRARADRNADMDRFERMQRNSSSDMKDMMREMMGTVRDVSASNAQAMSGQYQRQADTQRQMYEQRQDFDRQRYEDQRARADEYRQDAYHQQDRMDHTQDVAMGNMSQIGTAVAGNVGTQRNDINMNQGYAPQQYQQPAYNEPQQPQYQEQYKPQQPAGRFCPSCGAEVPEGEMFCGECGQRMD